MCRLLRGIASGEVPVMVDSGEKAMTELIVGHEQDSYKQIIFKLHP